MIADLKSLVGQLARSRVFSPEGNAITQEQTVALCVRLVTVFLANKDPQEIRDLVEVEMREILDLYRLNREES